MPDLMTLLRQADDGRRYHYEARRDAMLADIGNELGKVPFGSSSELAVAQVERAAYLRMLTSAADRAARLPVDALSDWLRTETAAYRRQIDSAGTDGWCRDRMMAAARSGIETFRSDFRHALVVLAQHSAVTAVASSTALAALLVWLAECKPGLRRALGPYIDARVATGAVDRLVSRLITAAITPVAAAPAVAVANALADCHESGASLAPGLPARQARRLCRQVADAARGTEFSELYSTFLARLTQL